MSHIQALGQQGLFAPQFLGEPANILQQVSDFFICFAEFWVSSMGVSSRGHGGGHVCGDSQLTFPTLSATISWEASRVVFVELKQVKIPSVGLKVMSG